MEIIEIIKNDFHVEQHGSITCVLGDCMDVMKYIQEGEYNLAVVDPPYGIDAGKMQMGSGKKQWKKADWDAAIPNAEYFNELKRVSGNQVIWGAITLQSI